jgi:hypothetical protein
MSRGRADGNGVASAYGGTAPAAPLPPSPSPSDCSSEGWFLVGMHGSGPDDVWAVGSSGTIVHLDGAAWSASASGTTDNLFGVWTSDPHQAWAVGDFVSILHRDTTGH